MATYSRLIAPGRVRTPEDVAGFVARRLVISASEDVGMADPTALPLAVAAAQAVQLIGMPEGRIVLGQAVVHLATAPKSNASYTAIGAALDDVRAGLAGPVPPGLRDAHYAGAKELGHGGSYVYPHAHPDGVVPQQYPPDALVGRDYYRPTGRGAEAPIAARLAKLRAIVRRQPREHRSEERASSGPVRGVRPEQGVTRRGLRRRSGTVT